MSTLSTAQTEALKAKQNLTQDQRQLVGSTLGLLGRAGVTDPQVAIKELRMLSDQNPDNVDLKNLIEKSYVPVFTGMQAGPQVADSLVKASQSILTPAQIQERFAPQAGTLNTGEQVFQTVTTPGVGNIAPRIQLGAQPLADIGIPPTQEVIDSVTGQKRLIGPASQRTNTPIVTNLGPAQTSLLGASGTNIAEDLSKTLADAKEAPTRIATFQNIKKLAPEAFVGVGGARKELAAGIAGAVGWNIFDAEKTATDELAKNTNLLTLTGGNTDAARAIAEAANPNKKMTEKALKDVADQLIGIEKMKVARANFLAPAQNDAALFAQRQQQFNGLSDYRLFQEMSREEVKKLFDSMSPAARTEMTNKVKAAKSLGIIK